MKPASMGMTSAEVYTDLEYAVPVHEGHNIVAFGRATGRKQRANPWMDRAVKKSDGFISKLFDKTADKVVKEITK